MPPPGCSRAPDRVLQPPSAGYPPTHLVPVITNMIGQSSLRRPLPADPAATVSPRGPEKPPRDTPLPLLLGSGVGVRWQAHWTCPRVHVSALSSSYRTAGAGNGLLGATPRRLLVFLGHCGGAGGSCSGNCWLHWRSGEGRAPRPGPPGGGLSAARLSFLGQP